MFDCVLNIHLIQLFTFIKIRVVSMEVFTQNVVQNVLQPVGTYTRRDTVNENALMVVFALPILFYKMVNVSEKNSALAFIIKFGTKVVTKSKKTVTPGEAESFLSWMKAYLKSSWHLRLLGSDQVIVLIIKRQALH